MKKVLLISISLFLLFINETYAKDNFSRYRLIVNPSINTTVNESIDTLSDGSVRTTQISRNVSIGTKNDVIKIIDSDEYGFYYRTVSVGNGRIRSASEMHYMSKENYYKSTGDLNLKDRITFDFGAVTMPIKLRFASKDSLKNKSKDFDFTSNFNVGATAGLKIAMNEEKTASTSILLGVSITTVKIDSRESQGKFTDKIDVAAFTPSFNIVFSYKTFKAGVGVGWDILSQAAGKYWIYNKTPWLGLGIGVTIVDTENAQAKNNLIKYFKKKK